MKQLRGLYAQTFFTFRTTYVCVYVRVCIYVCMYEGMNVPYVMYVCMCTYSNVYIHKITTQLQEVINLDKEVTI
jgi:hypothetical protein